MTVRRALITGGAGFIGSHTAERFLTEGWEVIIVDDLSTGKIENVPHAARLIQADIRSDVLTQLVRTGELDVIVHLAAQIDVRKSVAHPVEDGQINILGSLSLLEGVRALTPERRPRVVFASTGGALYGEGVTMPTPETQQPGPDSPYGIAKLAVEYYLAYYARVHGLDTAVARFGNVYGPRQDPHGEAGVIAIFGRTILEGQPIVVFGDGKQVRDFIYVADVAEALFRLASSQPPLAGHVASRAFNIGTGVETSVLDVVRAISDCTGRDPRISFAPARPGDIMRSSLEVSKANNVLGWRADVDLATGVARTLAWIEEYSSAGSVESP